MQGGIKAKSVLKAARQLRSEAAKILRCIDARMRRGIVGYEKRIFIRHCERMRGNPVKRVTHVKEVRMSY